MHAKESRLMRALCLTATTLPPAPASNVDALPSLVRNETDLCDRLAQAMPGGVIAYHLGMLARDRAPTCQLLPERRRLDLNAIADRVLQLAAAGRVHLLQRRIGPDRFAYLAIVRSRPRPRTVRTRMAITAPRALLAEAA
jgi:hypothetical protein